MLITILASIIVYLGVAALAALIVKLVAITFKKFISIVKETLATKVGGTVVIMNVKRVANEAIKEAELTGNKKNLAQLKEMADKEGFTMAVQDANGNISPDDIKIYEADQMDPNINKAMDEEGVLVLGE